MSEQWRTLYSGLSSLNHLGRLCLLVMMNKSARDAAMARSSSRSWIWFPSNFLKDHIGNTVSTGMRCLRQPCVLRTIFSHFDYLRHEIDGIFKCVHWPGYNIFWKWCHVKLGKGLDKQVSLQHTFSQVTRRRSETRHIFNKLTNDVLVQYSTANRYRQTLAAVLRK